MKTVSPRCLGSVPIRTDETQCVVRPPCSGRPDLGAVDDPFVAVAHGRRERTGNVGASARFREELHPHLLTLEHRREVALLLPLGAVLHEDGAAGNERGHVHHLRHLVPTTFVRERFLVRGREPETAVLLREADAGEAAVEDHALEGSPPRHRRELRLVGQTGVEDLRRLAPREVVGQPGASATAERVDRLDHLGVGRGRHRTCPASSVASPR